MLLHEHLFSHETKTISERLNAAPKDFLTEYHAMKCFARHYKESKFLSATF